MEILSFIVFLTGVALATSECSLSKIQNCLNMTRYTFENIVGSGKLYDSSTLCSDMLCQNNSGKSITNSSCLVLNTGSSKPTTITGFSCFKNEVNNCPEGVSFMDKEHVELMNKLTNEGLQKSCSLLSNMAVGSFSCFTDVMSKTPSAQECFSRAGAAMLGIKMTPSEQQCRIFDANYKCGIEPTKKKCSANVGADIDSWHEAMGILLACNYAGNGSSSCNSAPSFLLTVIGVVVLATFSS